MSDPWRSVPGWSLGPTAPLAPRPPAEAGRYLREALIGAGGMGRVHLAFDTRLQRFVALKEASDDGAAQDALAREARITAALDHPGIVAVHDVGEGDDGRPFYAMRLVRGRSLDAVLEGAPLPARLALLTHFRDACQALAYAHAQGVVHRDIKPANLLIGAFGETQVVDWGLAVPVGEAPAEVVGSVPWMAPEQARGQPADARTDVFGLGAVLVHLLTGRPPYPHADGSAALAAAREADLPALSEPSLPAELVAVVEKATRADPDARYPDARALADDIERYLVGDRVSAHAYTPWELLRRLVSAWRAPLAVGGLAGLALVGLILADTQQVAAERNRAVHAEAEAEAALAAALVSQARSALLRGAEGEAGVLAAEALAIAETPEARGAWVAAQAMWPVARIAHEVVRGCPGARLNGAGLLCRSGDAVWRMEGGREVWRVAAAPLTVTPSGPRVLIEEAKTARELDGETGEVLAVHARDVGGLPVVGAADGRFASRRWEGRSWSGRLDDAREHTICGPHGVPRESTLHPTLPRFASWCADGTLAIEDEAGVQRWPTGLSVAEHGDASWLAFSPDGSSLAIGYHRGRLAVVELASGGVRVAPARGELGIRQVAWAPDGQRLATVRDSGDVDVWSPRAMAVVASLPLRDAREVRWDDADRLRVLSDALSVWAVDGRDVLPARTHPLGVRDLVFSPDGARLASAHSDGLGRIWPTAGEDPDVALDFGVGTVMSLGWLGPDTVFGSAGESFGLWGFAASGEPLWGMPTPTNYRAVLPQPDGTFVGVRFEAGLDRLDRAGNLRELDCPSETWIGGDGPWLLGLDGTVRSLRGDVCEPPLAGLRARRLVRFADGLLVVGSEGLRRLEPDGRVRWTTALEPELGLDLAVSADGRWVAAAGLDRAVRVFRGEDGALTAVLRGHTKRVSGVAFSPDGVWLASAGWDGAVRTWPVAALTGPATPSEISAAELLRE